MSNKVTHVIPLQWRHNERNGVSDDQPHDCLLIHLFGSRWNEASKLSVTGLFVWNSPVTGEFPAQRASNAENVSILMTSSCYSVLSLSHHLTYNLGVIYCRCLTSANDKQVSPFLRGHNKIQAHSSLPLTLPDVTCCEYRVLLSSWLMCAWCNVLRISCTAVIMVLEYQIESWYFIHYVPQTAKTPRWIKEAKDMVISIHNVYTII